MRVLVACEFSGVVREAFRARGHDAWSCDLLPAEDGSDYHFQGDLFGNGQIRNGWDLMIAHPPCTYLCRAGWHWVNKPDREDLPLMGEPRRKAALAAAYFFKTLLDAPIPRICIENPVPIKHAGLPPYSQKIQPWQFGHGETKATCLWLKGLPKLTPTNIVEGREARIHKMGRSPTRGMERSRTFRGIAEAMAAQWGDPRQLERVA